MALSHFVVLSIFLSIIWILRLIYSMIKLIEFMMHHFLQGVVLKMLFGLILTLKLIIFDL